VFEQISPEALLGEKCKKKKLNQTLLKLKLAYAIVNL